MGKEDYSYSSHLLLRLNTGVKVFPEERRHTIVEILERDGRVTVEDLAKRFDVSVDSIRKDLQALSAQGACRRVYGGAMRINKPKPKTKAVAAQDPRTLPTPQADYEQLDDLDAGRMAVAQRAFKEIGDGDAVFLDISRTNLFLADLLADSSKRCIVTSNMFGVLQRLSKNPRITALGTGGYLNIDMSGFIGSATVSLLEPLLFAKAFIGANGIDLETQSVMTSQMDDGMVKSRALQNASSSYLLADAGKFSRHGAYRFATITDFSAVITDTTDEAVISRLGKLSVPVMDRVAKVGVGTFPS